MVSNLCTKCQKRQRLPTSSWCGKCKAAGAKVSFERARQRELNYTANSVRLQQFQTEAKELSEEIGNLPQSFEQKYLLGRMKQNTENLLLLAKSLNGQLK